MPERGRTARLIIAEITGHRRHVLPETRRFADVGDPAGGPLERFIPIADVVGVRTSAGGLAGCSLLRLLFRLIHQLNGLGIEVAEVRQMRAREVFLEGAVRKLKHIGTQVGQDEQPSALLDGLD